MWRGLAFLLAWLLPVAGLAATVETTSGRVTIATVADGFDVPWVGSPGTELEFAL